MLKLGNPVYYNFPVFYSFRKKNHKRTKTGDKISGNNNYYGYNVIDKNNHTILLISFARSISFRLTIDKQIAYPNANLCYLRIEFVIKVAILICLHE